MARAVLELQAVFVDPLARFVEVGDELLQTRRRRRRAGAPGVRGELAAGGRRDDQRSLTGHRMDAAEREVGLAADRLHLLGLGGKSARTSVPGRSRSDGFVDRFGDAGLVEGHRGVRHDGGALGDAGQHRLPRRFQVVDDVDTESVLLEREDGRRDGSLGESGEAVDLGRGHLRAPVIAVSYG